MRSLTRSAAKRPGSAQLCGPRLDLLTRTILCIQYPAKVREMGRNPLFTWPLNKKSYDVPFSLYFRRDILWLCFYVLLSALQATLFPDLLAMMVAVPPPPLHSVCASCARCADMAQHAFLARIIYSRVCVHIQ